MYITMSFENQQITVPALDDLEPGHVVVRAPIERDAIQVNTRALGDLHKLDVHIASGAVTICRKDNKPIKVEMYHKSPVEGEPRIPKPVLSDAIGTLALERCTNTGLWVFRSEEATIEDLYGMNFFLNVLVAKVQEKQLHARQRRELTQQNSPVSRRHKLFSGLLSRRGA